MTWILPASLGSPIIHYSNCSDTSFLSIPITMDSYLLIAMQVLATMSPSQKEFPWLPGLLSSYCLITWFYFLCLLVISPTKHTRARARAHACTCTHKREKEGLSVFFSQLFPHYPLNQMETPRSHYSLPVYPALCLSIHSSHNYCLMVLSTTKDCHFRKNMKCTCPIHHYFSTTHISPPPGIEIHIMALNKYLWKEGRREEGG